MADYISTLTGAQMDASLLDMAEHTSEAYAVGERNGVAVGSDDVTYHNNARYYAQQAQSIAPASVTEAVRWDVAQTALTDAQREQGRENIKATSHNYNLFDNGWFTVNSRNATSGATPVGVYFVDRWATDYTGTGGASGTYSVGSSGITITGAGTAFSGFRQFVSTSLADGTTYTVSIKYGDGTIETATRALSLSSNTYFINSDSVLVMRLASSGVWRILFGGTKVIRAVKLELGSFSTLAYDTPPDYGEELTRCIYSKADPTDPYANNGFGRSNPNLLDNWYFVGGGSQLGDGVFPINQRGFTNYSSSGMCIDRWHTDGGFTVSSSGVSQTYSTAAFQIVDAQFFARLLGKTFTLSLLLTDGTIKSGQITLAKSVPTSAEFYNAFNDGSHYAATILYPGGNGQLFRFGGNNIAAVKMEYGTVSTLANDVPPDYGTELAKCQRYFQRISFSSTNYPIAYGYAYSATAIRYLIPLPVTMRTTPTLALTNSFLALGTNAGTNAVTAFTPVATFPNGVLVLGTTSNHTIGISILMTGANATLDFSADL